MLRSLKDLERYTVTATDGDIDKVVDFLIDDEDWIVRYLVVEAGKRLSGREVLISPISFGHVDWSARRFHVALTKAKIENAPSIETDLPVSRQRERDYSRYYGYSHYWEQLGYPGRHVGPSQPADNSDDDVHLRSANEVNGYSIQGTDDAIGHVHDLIVEDETWDVRYLVIDTSNWAFGRKVLVAPRWASRIEWAEKNVYVDLSRDVIKNSPEWNAREGVNRQYETRLYDYYGRPVYWAPDQAALPSDHGAHPGSH